MFISKQMLIIGGVILGVLAMVGIAVYLIGLQQAGQGNVINNGGANSTIPASTTGTYISSSAYSLPVTASMSSTTSAATSVSTSSAVTSTSSATSGESSSKAAVQKSYLNPNFSNVSFDLPANWTVLDGVVTVENNAGINKVANGLVIKNRDNDNRINLTFGIYDGDKGPNLSSIKNRWLSDSEYFVLKNDWVRVKMVDPISKQEIFAYVPPKNIILGAKKEFDKEKTKCDDIRNGKIEGDQNQCVNYRSASALVDGNAFQYINTTIKEKLLIDPKQTIINDEVYKKLFEQKSLSFVSTLTFTGKIVDEADKIIESIAIDLK